MYAHLFQVATFFQVSLAEPIRYSIRATCTADFFFLEFFTEIVLVGCINHKAPNGTTSLLRPNNFLSFLF
jgi:hypothetical protein